MKECHAIDALITSYVDGEASDGDCQVVKDHLCACASCRIEVEAESTARHVVRAHAAVARTMGMSPPWRPRARRLGQPALVVRHPALTMLGATAAVFLVALLMRPSPVEATGIISDSRCGDRHSINRPGLSDRTCVLSCVAQGAEFVLVAGSTVHRITNQDLPDLRTLAHKRVAVSGSVTDAGFTISRIVATSD